MVFTPDVTFIVLLIFHAKVVLSISDFGSIGSLAEAKEYYFRIIHAHV